MEPLAALSVASNIIQIVDFSSRIISRGHELYQSIDGRTEEHMILNKAAENLSELYNDLQKPTKTSLRHLSSTDKQLLRLKAESEVVVQKLRQALDKAKLNNKHRTWQSIYQALRSVHSDKEIAKLAAQLDHIRKQVDSALLISLRQKLDLLSIQQVDFSTTKGLFGEKQRVKDLLQAVDKNNWQPSQANDMNAFSVQLQSNTAADLETQFRNALLSRLYFQHMFDRSESIPMAYVDTFQWIFTDKDNQNDSTPWNNFKQWLSQDHDSIYWITGKPGSGKSTLMKFLYNHDDIDGLLQTWTGSKDLIKAGFYFWNSGGVMQMSRLGLLQTLLYTCLQTHSDLIRTAFPERREQFLGFGGGRDPVTWPELKRAFKNITSDRSRKFFFLIDGLDEFEGEPKEIIDMVLSVAHPNVKLCIASRPWLPFEDAFKNRPNLRLEDLTRGDISVYVTGHFQTNEDYLRLKQEDIKGALALIQEIVDKASGVFLWVYLVVQSLLEGLSNSDRMSDLQERLSVLPSDLEALFDKLLSSLEPKYFEQACQIFRLLRMYRERGGDLDLSLSSDTPSLLAMYYADNEDTSSSLHAPYINLRMRDAQRMAEYMRRRLIACCKGFLEIFHPQTQRHLFDHEIIYIHRTARDYVESESYWQIVLKSTSNNTFQPDRRWANANLWLQKVHPLINVIGEGWGFDHSRCMSRCIISATAIQRRTGIIQKTYLDELFRNPYLRPANTDSIEVAVSYKKYTYSDYYTTAITFEMARYLLVVLQTTITSDRKRIIGIIRFAYKHQGYFNGLQAAAGENHALKKHIYYYLCSRRIRWLHRRPAIPRYE